MARIRIGVAVHLENTISSVIRPIEDGFRRARKTVEGETRAMTKASGSAYRDSAREADRSFKTIERDSTSMSKIVMSQTSSMANAMIRDFQRAEREADRSNRRMGRMFAAAAFGTTRRLGGAALGVAGSIARGAGVDFSLSGLVGKSVSAQKLATDISNSAFMPGEKGANGRRQDPAALLAQVRGVANETATSTDVALEGLQKFVGKTGDLETGRDILKDLAVYSRATGTSLEDMVDASGDVANALGETDNKGEKVKAVMRTIAGQGKLGAVEIRNLATQMAKLSAMAPQFQGEAGHNIGIMGALVQETRQRGGAASATQAATSLTSFVNSFSKKQRRSAFAAAGVKIEDATGALLNPEEIIVNSLRKTGGKSAGMGKLFMDAGARRVTRGFETVYRQAGGGEAGIAAVRAEFQRLEKSTMANEEVNESFARSMDTAEAKATVFQNNLERVASTLADRVLPEMEKLAPKALQLADALGKMIGYAVDNPIKAGALALAAAIAKAGVESVIKEGIAGIFQRISGAGGGGGGGKLGAAGLGVAVGAAVGYGIYSKGTSEIDDARAKGDKGLDAANEALRKVYQEAGTKKHVSAESEAELKRQKELLEKRVEAAKAQGTGDVGFFGTASALANSLSGGKIGGKRSLGEVTAAKQDAQSLQNVEALLKDINQALRGTLKVNAPPGAQTDPAGRTPPNAAPTK